MIQYGHIIHQNNSGCILYLKMPAIKITNLKTLNDLPSTFLLGENFAFIHRRKRLQALAYTLESLLNIF